MINNLKKTTVTVSEEEVEEIKNLDWAGYFRDYPNENGYIRHCTACKVMIFPKAEDKEHVCGCCGERNVL